MSHYPALRLEIDAAACIGCERCVRICTSRIFYVAEPETTDNPTDDRHSAAQSTRKRIGLQEPELCIRCGHCVAVCPANAITHGDFPAETIHTFNPALRPSPEQMLELIRTRRSNRAFSGAEVPEAALARIIEAAHRAPTASNAQQVAIVQVHDPAVIRDLSRLTVETFLNVARKLESPLVKPFVKPFMPGVYRLFPKMRMLAAEMENGKDFVLRNAKEVLFFYTPGSNRFGCQDANLAYQNASLMAESLDVAHFYTGFVCAAFKQNPKPFLKCLGIEGRIQAGMALGMPAFRFERYIDRRPLDFKKI
ncbi:MAG: nitroreductase family protein [Bacteroidales bacterium]|nr:nitroreductase family protein [Bacteroidales bacterium]